MTNKKGDKSKRKEDKTETKGDKKKGEMHRPRKRADTKQ